MTGLPIGLLYQMWETPEVSTEALVERALGDFAVAESLGYASAWVGEHHYIPQGRSFYGRVSHPEMLLVKAAAAIPRMRFGTGVKVLPDISAARAAEEMSMLDLLSGGRADFGIGQGTGYVGTARERRLEIFRGRLDDILRMLDGTDDVLPSLPFDDGARVRSNIWVACRDESSITHAARNGLNFVVGQAENATPQAEHIAHYRRQGGIGRVRGVRAVYVAESREQGWAEFREAFDLYRMMFTGPQGAYTREAIAAGLLPVAPQSDAEWLRQANVIFGTPDEVAQQITEYLEITGVDCLDLMVQFPRLSADCTRRSLELFSVEVWPQIRSLLAAA